MAVNFQGYEQHKGLEPMCSLWSDVKQIIFARSTCLRLASSLFNVYIIAELSDFKRHEAPLEIMSSRRQTKTLRRRPLKKKQVIYVFSFSQED